MTYSTYSSHIMYSGKSILRRLSFFQLKKKMDFGSFQRKGISKLIFSKLILLGDESSHTVRTEVTEYVPESVLEYSR